jgi:hypothetical protein
MRSARISLPDYKRDAIRRDRTALEDLPPATRDLANLLADIAVRRLRDQETVPSPRQVSEIRNE